jgi:hypothetical protein
MRKKNWIRILIKKFWRRGGVEPWRAWTLTMEAGRLKDGAGSGSALK